MIQRQNEIEKLLLDQKIVGIDATCSNAICLQLSNGKTIEIYGDSHWIPGGSFVELEVYEKIENEED